MAHGLGKNVCGKGTGTRGAGRGSGEPRPLAPWSIVPLNIRALAGDANTCILRKPLPGPRPDAAGAKGADVERTAWCAWDRRLPLRPALPPSDKLEHRIMCNREDPACQRRRA